ncbi:MAG: DUF3393 domain-containing protein [Helicobacteraceae bacterium]|nr:DUF3393 domain-containing protein [Helicobacteraceae bacterium]
MNKLASIFLLLVIINLFSACTPSQINQSLNVLTQLPTMNTEKALRLAGAQHPAIAQVLASEKIIHKQLVEFLNIISEKWEQKPKVASQKEYVKYLQDYKSRSIVDFEHHSVTIETIDNNYPKRTLKEAIVSTLLTPYDPSDVDLHSSKAVKLGKTPFLYNLVVDQNKKPLRWEWSTNKFASYLLKNSYKSKLIKTAKGEKTIHYVDIAMVQNALHNQAKELAPFVNKNATRFKLHPSLIYAIIETESSFNPYATSAIPAYGLMQIVPHSAGVDSWKFLKGKDGMPTRSYLFNEKNNIEMGSAYLHIINTKYLKAITDKRSREYCTIAAYNTGSGNVLKTFYKNDRSRAIKVINSLTPSQVYSKLRSSLPYKETRDYMKKVTEAKKRFI